MAAGDGGQMAYFERSREKKARRARTPHFRKKQHGKGFFSPSFMFGPSRKKKPTRAGGVPASAPPAAPVQGAAAQAGSGLASRSPAQRAAFQRMRTEFQKKQKGRGFTGDEHDAAVHKVGPYLSNRTPAQKAAVKRMRAGLARWRAARK